ncbi:hypothetical protein [Terricaulis sp.]|uniref:hypothetical protein n=1 Tax=Terricaulis sp. TaxID=2768686 RepID=UPI003783AF93
MRWELLVFLVAALFGAPAFAQPSAITLNADPAPIVEAEINGRPVRLEVDLRMTDNLILSDAAAQRLGVQRVPFMAIRVSVDGGASMRGRVARPRLVFGREDARALSGVFPVPVSTRADGVIGPGVLPYDVVTVVLGPETPGMRDIVWTLDDADMWRARTQLGGRDTMLLFDVANAASVFNMAAARAFDDAGLIHAAGELRETPLILGLRTNMQPVTTDLSVEGLGLGPAMARTQAPLLGALEEDAIVVEGRGEANPPELSLGREALAHCAFVRVERRTRRMTLRCA